MERDIKNYDYLTISIKTAQLNSILECYRALGWQVFKSEDDRQYYDMKYISMRRPHKIENKDRLQLLQVRMETGVNQISAIYAKKHLKSGILFSVLTALGLALLAFGLWLIFESYAQIAWGIVCCVVAGALIAVADVILCVLRKPEEEAAERRILQILKSLQALLSEADTLSAPASGGVQDSAEEVV